MWWMRLKMRREMQGIQMIQWGIPTKANCATKWIKKLKKKKINLCVAALSGSHSWEGVRGQALQRERTRWEHHLADVSGWSLAAPLRHSPLKVILDSPRSRRPAGKVQIQQSEVSAERSHPSLTWQRDNVTVTDTRNFNGVCKEAGAEIFSWPCWSNRDETGTGSKVTDRTKAPREDSGSN